MLQKTGDPSAPQKGREREKKNEENKRNKTRTIFYIFASVRTFLSIAPVKNTENRRTLHKPTSKLQVTKPLQIAERKPPEQKVYINGVYVGTTWVRFPNVKIGENAVFRIDFSVDQR